MGTATQLAIITGASSGIGRCVAQRLAKRGYRTVLIARRAELLNALAKELAIFAPSVAVPLDLSIPEAIDRIFPTMIEEHGPADVLVNNAGFGLYREFEKQTPADLEK